MVTMPVDPRARGKIGETVRSLQQRRPRWFSHMTHKLEPDYTHDRK